jgi:hypothetical protein
MTPKIYELFFDGTGPGEEEQDGDRKIIWKDILREGDFPLTPGLTGIQRKPFKVIADGDSDPGNRIISMSDLENSFKDGAFEHVTIPTKHETDDDPLDNHGYVVKLRRKVKDGVTFMQAGMGFTEPDTAGKVRRGTVPNVSSGIFFNFLNKAKNKKYPVALKHVCFSKVPFINKLEPFQPAFFSDDEINEPVEMETYMFADAADNGDGGDDKGSTDTGETIVWEEEGSYRWLQRALEAELNPPRDTAADMEGAPVQPRAYYYIQDVKSDKALVEESYKGNITRFVIPFSIKDGAVQISPQLRWIEAKEAMVAASDDDNKPFEEQSMTVLREKLGTALSVTLGEHAQGYEVADVSLDHRAKIKSVVDGQEYVAKFVQLGGNVLIDPVNNWEAIEASANTDPPKADAPQPAPAASVAVTASDNSIDGRLKAARLARQRLLAQ